MTICSVFFYSIVKDGKHPEYHTNDLHGCKVLAGFSFVYESVVLCQVFRVCMSCYMAMKQSRKIEDCNKEFFMVMSHEAEENLRLKAKKDRQEMVEREKAKRRQRFYDEYAEDQLSRIITSLMKGLPASDENSDDEASEANIGAVTSDGNGERQETMPRELEDSEPEQEEEMKIQQVFETEVSRLLTTEESSRDSFQSSFIHLQTRSPVCKKEGALINVSLNERSSKQSSSLRTTYPLLEVQEVSKLSYSKR